MTRALVKDSAKHEASGRHRLLRGFRLGVVYEGPENYGVLLEETNGDPSKAPVPVARLDAPRTQRVIGSVFSAIKASGLVKSALSQARKKPLCLTEEAGVRLALVLLSTAPVARPSRAEAMADAVESMSVEEAYYWYARAMGPSAARVRRALRLFLAEE